MPGEGSHRHEPAAAPSRHVPFDQYQRYRITADIARALAASQEGRAPRILDVGGHFEDLEGHPRRPIAEFLPDWFTVTVDLPPNPSPGYVRGRGDALPFGDGQFDFVCSVDVLEHVPASNRPTLIDQALRTSRRAVLLAAPFASPAVERSERLLGDFVERTCGYVQGQLKEHRECGLPDLAATRTHFSAAGWTSIVFRHGNLWRWLFMMLDKHAVAAALPEMHHLLDERYNDELFATDNEIPCYRHFLLACRDRSDPLLEFASDRFAGAIVPAAGGSVDGSSSTTEADSMLKVAELHASNLHLQVVNERLRKGKIIETLERHLAVKTERLAWVERLLRDVEASPSYRLSRALKRLLGRRS